jgi:hypothetical protein
LLLVLSDFLINNGLKIEEIDAIFVLNGIGSFTSSRLSVLVSNIIFVLTNIQVFSLDNKPKNFSNLKELFEKSEKKLIIPKYSSEPNISK